MELGVKQICQATVELERRARERDDTLQRTVESLLYLVACDVAVLR